MAAAVAEQKTPDADNGVFHVPLGLFCAGLPLLAQAIGPAAADQRILISPEIPQRHEPAPLDQPVVGAGEPVLLLRRAAIAGAATMAAGNVFNQVDCAGERTRPAR